MPDLSHCALTQLFIRPAHGAGSKAELGSPPHCCSLRGSLGVNIIISLLQVRKSRLRKIEFTCLEIIQIVGDGDRINIQVS